MTVEIKTMSGQVIYTSDGATIRDAVREAVRGGADLSANLFGVHLHDEDLAGADLYGADLAGARGVSA